MLASREAGLCASGSLLCMHSPLNSVLPAHSAAISSFERSLGKFSPPARDRCGDDPGPPRGPLALMVQLYCCHLYSVLPAPAPPAQGVLMSFPLHSYCLSR